jgi:hypothetical protein
LVVRYDDLVYDGSPPTHVVIMPFSLAVSQHYTFGEDRDWLPSLA